ncbi:MAG: glycosyltransferase family 4 protein [Nitrosospira sp.]
MIPAPQIVMIGTSLDLQGGVAAVIGVYRDNGFFERWGVEYVPTNCTGGTLRKTVRSLLAASLFFGLLLRGGGKVVHVHTSSYFSFWRKSLFLAPAFFFRRSVVVSLHGGGFREFYGTCGPIGRWWIRTVMRKAARFIVLTGGWKQWVLSIVPETNVCTIPNVCSDSACFRLAESVDRASPRVLFLGRLEMEKGFNDLLLAIARIRDRIPEIRLICGGTGDESEVKNWIESAGVSDLVELRGWISGTAKHECFEHAALLALPSYIENLPMVIIEAMAASLPVVASAVGGIPDVIEDGKDGLLVQPGDVCGLADAVARLLQNHPMREQMARNARQKYENRYSSHSVIPQVEAVYRELGMVPISSITR